MLLNMHPVLPHSLVVGKVAVFIIRSLVIGKVAVLSVVDINVTVLEDVDGKVAVLKVVVDKDLVLLVVFVTIELVHSAEVKLEGTEPIPGTSVLVDCHQWSVIAAGMQPLKLGCC